MVSVEIDLRRIEIILHMHIIDLHDIMQDELLKIPYSPLKAPRRKEEKWIVEITCANAYPR